MCCVKPLYLHDVNFNNTMKKSFFSVLAFSLLLSVSSNAMNGFGEDKDKDKKKARKTCCTKKETASSCSGKIVAEKSCNGASKEQKSI